MARGTPALIQPSLLVWARDSAGLDIDALAHRFPKLTEWERGAAKPTLKQLEKVRQRHAYK